MDGENSPSIFLLIHRRVTEVAEKKLLRKEFGSFFSLIIELFLCPLW